MSNLDQLIQSIKHSPQLPQALAKLYDEFEAEKQRRSVFYQDMTPDQKIEFIAGEVVLHSPARYQHLVVTQHLSSVLSLYVSINKLGRVMTEKCLCVFPRNDYEPDVVFFSNAKSSLFDNNTMMFPIPDLIVEVLSESTEARDRGVKFEDFEANGVAEYWIVDADRSTVEQYVQRDGKLQLEQKTSDGTLRSVAIRGLAISAKCFFDEQTNIDTLRQLLAK
jgi:Uma2 family endonuclease